MHAAVHSALVSASAATNPYHPARHNSAPLDVLLVTIGLIVLVLIVVIPAQMARNREDRALAATQPHPPEAA